jgi:hypothetical protein
LEWWFCDGGLWGTVARRSNQLQRRREGRMIHQRWSKPRGRTMREK